MKIRTGNIGKFSTGLLSTFQLMYSGMPTTETFAICPLLTGGYYTPMIYYPVESEVIWILEQGFNVIAIDANYIELDLIKT